MGTRVGDESVAAHSAVRPGSRRMVTDDTVAVLAEVPDSKSIGLARCECCHAFGTSGEDSQSRDSVTMGSQGSTSSQICNPCDIMDFEHDVMKP